MAKVNTSLYAIRKWPPISGWLVRYFSKRSFDGLENKEFSIFSNNCTAGFIYQDAGLEYRTPTIGLFFYAPCYISLLTNFNLINSPIRFVKTSKYKTANQQRKQSNRYYPIGVINGDIEVHFLHYQSVEEAREKWIRRLAKINYNNLLFLFSARDEVTDQLIRDFCSLSFPNKLCLSAKKIENQLNLIHFKEYEKTGEMPEADVARISVLRKIKFAELLNKLKKNTNLLAR